MRAGEGFDCDALQQFVDFAERGDGNFLFGAIDGDGFERPFLAQDVTTTERARQEDLSGDGEKTRVARLLLLA